MVSEDNSDRDIQKMDDFTLRVAQLVFRDLQKLITNGEVNFEDSDKYLEELQEELDKVDTELLSRGLVSFS